MPKRLVYILSIFLLLAPLPANSSPLKDVMGSNEYRRTLGNEAQVNRRIKDKGFFEENTNYGKIFLDDRGQEAILIWMGKLGPRYHLRYRNTGHRPEYLWGSKEYMGPNKELVFTKVLIPHPRSYATVEHGLVDEFNQVNPKEEEVQKKESFRINGVDFESYLLTKDRCLAAGKLSKQSVVLLKITRCKDLSLARDIAEEIDVRTLNRKLDS